MLGERALVGDAPDRAAGVVGDQQRAVLGDGKSGGAAPDLGELFARRPEAGREILVPAFGTAVLERHAHDLVPGRHGAVPRALQRDKEAALVSGRKLVALVKDRIEQRGVRGEQLIGGNRGFDLVGCQRCEARHRVLADIGVGPAVEAALLHPDQRVGRHYRPCRGPAIVRLQSSNRVWSRARPSNRDARPASPPPRIGRRSAYRSRMSDNARVRTSAGSR